VVIFIHHPTLDLKYDAQTRYAEAYEFAKDAGVLEIDDIVECLKSYQMWSDDKDKLLNDLLPEKIENLKVDIFKANMEIDRREALREELRKSEKSLAALYNAKHNFDNFSCLGIALITKLEYILKSCCKHEDGKECDWSNVNLKEIIQFYNENTIDEVMYRELARTEPWSSIWSAGKRNNRIFDKSAPEMSEEQTKLISYSHFYDQIREHPECPHESIIEDDDMLDGWLILQKRERDKDQNEKTLDNRITNEKILNSQEIFIVAKNDDELAKINNLNSSHAKAIKQSRLNTVQKKGEALDEDFPDVRRDLTVQLNKMETQRK
jgi:hypothetical protein